MGVLSNPGNLSPLASPGTVCQTYTRQSRPCSGVAATRSLAGSRSTAHALRRQFHDPLASLVALQRKRYSSAVAVLPKTPFWGDIRGTPFFNRAVSPLGRTW